MEMLSIHLLAFTLGPMELAIVALVGVLLFGTRIPSVMRNLGRGVREFNSGIRGVETDLEEAAK